MCNCRMGAAYGARAEDEARELFPRWLTEDPKVEPDADVRDDDRRHGDPEPEDDDASPRDRDASPQVPVLVGA